MRDTEQRRLGMADLHMAVVDINQIVADWLGRIALSVDENGQLVVTLKAGEISGI